MLMHVCSLRLCAAEEQDHLGGSERAQEKGNKKERKRARERNMEQILLLPRGSSRCLSTSTRYSKLRYLPSPPFTKVPKAL